MDGNASAAMCQLCAYAGDLYEERTCKNGLLHPLQYAFIAPRTSLALRRPSLRAGKSADAIVPVIVLDIRRDRIFEDCHRQVRLRSHRRDPNDAARLIDR